MPTLSEPVLPASAARFCDPVVFAANVRGPETIPSGALSTGTVAPRPPIPFAVATATLMLALAGVTLSGAVPAAETADSAVSAPVVVNLPAPQLFAPGVVSSVWTETSAALTPDGREVYFTRSDYITADNTILVARFADGVWQRPRIASFSGEWRDSEPHVSPDGLSLYYVSNRPAQPGGEPLVAELNGRKFPGAHLWRVARQGRDWGRPERVEGAINDVPMVYNPSIAADGTLYFSGIRPDSGGRNQIYRAARVDGRYPVVEKLPFADNRWTHMDPAVDPGQSYLVFASNRPGSLEGSADLFISFRVDGVWQEPEWLGASVNSSALENAPSLSPDGRTVYFTSMRQPPVRYPKTRDDAAFERRLSGIENGTRNVWQVDIGALLDARLGKLGSPGAAVSGQ